MSVLWEPVLCPANRPASECCAGEIGRFHKKVHERRKNQIYFLLRIILSQFINNKFRIQNQTAFRPTTLQELESKLTQWPDTVLPVLEIVPPDCSVNIKTLL